MNHPSDISTHPLSAGTSRRIEALRVVLVIAIVVIHAKGHRETVGSLEIGPEDLGAGARFIQELVSDVFGRVAVPLFFLISGVLTSQSLRRHGYLSLLRSRGFGLLLPYMIWNTLVSFVYLIGSTSHPGGWDPLAIYGISSLPAAYHFWFVRDLIVLVVASPLLVAISARAPNLAIGGGLVLWFWSPAFLGAGGRAIDPAAVCFFAAGCSLAHRPVHLSPAACRWVLLVYLPLGVADAIVSNDSGAGFAFHKGVILCGMVAAWHLGGVLVRRSGIPAWLAGSTFMVYAAHEPLLGLLKKFAYLKLDPAGDLSVTAIYFASALLAIAICVVANQIAARSAPMLHSLLTGGRARRPVPTC